MLVKHLFCSLLERLDDLEEKWVASASTKQRRALYEEWRELRKLSDDILDCWLHFEERLSQFDQQMAIGTSDESNDAPFKKIPDDVEHKILQEMKNLATSPDASSLITYLSGDVARIFKKGQGYYDLLMFPQAADHFKKVVEQEPDLDIARMFLAYSEWMNGSLEEAHRHFHLLSKTAEQSALKATAFNALGCMMAGRNDWEKALNYFERAMEANPKLKDPRFNYGLVLMELKQYEKARSVWSQLADQDQKDWETKLQLAACLVAREDVEQANDILAEISRTVKEPEALEQTARMFEELREFGNAALCFQMALNEDPESAVAWHGLGWNLWHANGSPLGMEYIRKAIALSPKNPDFQFSYGWILYHQRAYEEAEKIFRTLLEIEGNYPLALAGWIQVLTSRRQWKEAEEKCQQLLDESHPSIQSLGYFQAGRLAMAQARYEQARKYFALSMRLDPQLKENQLWLGLAHYLNGERELAQEVWNERQE